MERWSDGLSIKAYVDSVEVGGGNANLQLSSEDIFLGDHVTFELQSCVRSYCLIIIYLNASVLAAVGLNSP